MSWLDAHYWDQRYETGETAWDIGYVSTPLKTYFDQITDKDLRILIPGAGNAYEAQYLVQQGFKHVTVCDLSKHAIRHVKEACAAYPTLTTIHGNFFQLQGEFDLIVEQTFFCAIHPDLRRKYFEKMAALLVPDGKLVGLLFDADLNSDRPPFGGHRADYLPLIPDELTIQKMETCYNSISPRAERELFMILQRRS